MGVNPLWDEVIISVYGPLGINSAYPIEGMTPEYPRGIIQYLGPNVNRVSVGQLVVFRKGAFIRDASNTWSVVPQDAILVTYTFPS